MPDPILQIDQKHTIALYLLHLSPVKHSTVVVNHHHIHGTERRRAVGTFVCCPTICRKQEGKQDRVLKLKGTDSDFALLHVLIMQLLLKR